MLTKHPCESCDNSACLRHGCFSGASASADRAGGLRPEPAAQSQPEALVPSAVPVVEFYQQDWIPGFAAFLPDSTMPEPEAKAFCVLNVGALMAAVATRDIDRGDLPYVIADCMIHELVHVLEQWAGVEFNEDRVEAVIERYRASIPIAKEDYQ